MTFSAAATPAATPAARVVRLDRISVAALVGAAALFVGFAALPFVFAGPVQNALTTVFLLVTMGSMWNLLAGYAGLVSFGQQAFLGVGAYTLLVAVRAGVNPFAAVPIAAVVSLAVAVPLSYGLFRTRGAYFAIATWVVAEAFRLLVITVPALGGGEGATLPPTGLDPVLRTALTYWAALAVVTASLLGIWLLLRSRIGLDAAAVRDDEQAAVAVGVRENRARRVPYLMSAAGFGAAGAVLFLANLRLEPASIFNVNYSANAFFMALIGGVGTIEGPVVGALVFYGLQFFLADLGAAYLVLLGVLAIVVMLVAPEGLWGRFSRRTGVVLFPIGYRVQVPGRRRRS
jgi:branched-chain amino acid transport system permease protein